MPLAAVIDSAFTWRRSAAGDALHETLIYELHVKGFSKLNHIRNRCGGVLGLASNQPSGIHGARRDRRGTDAVHHHLNDWHLAKKISRTTGDTTRCRILRRRFKDDVASPQDAVREFKMMVRALHAANLEVILDVVYNHSAEGNHATTCARGIDNTSYYRLQPNQPRFYQDFTGCGNTLNMRNPRVLQLIMDSLRYWVIEMHVDGFRFDLASALARELHAVDKLGAFFDIIHQDPVLSQVKLIAEPWDLGEGGYQVGNFPTKWTEWNEIYRDAVRRFCAATAPVSPSWQPTVWQRICMNSGRRPYASINFITAHDVTLADLVSYNQKHNEANGEGNADGENHNLAGIVAWRDRPRTGGSWTARSASRNMMATLMLSVGVPMISGGDELGRTQGVITTRIVRTPRSAGRRTTRRSAATSSTSPAA
jgi:glycogen operon protein